MKKYMKRIAVAIACLLLIFPAAVAQSSLATAQPLCKDGELVGVRLRVTLPGTYTILFGDGVCAATGRDEVAA
jgi:hypothetical protein